MMCSDVAQDGHGQWWEKKPTTSTTTETGAKFPANNVSAAIHWRSKISTSVSSFQNAKLPWFVSLLIAPLARCSQDGPPAPSNCSLTPILSLFPSVWTNTGHGKLKRHDFLLEAHDLRHSCAPLTYSFKSEVRQGILAVGTHDRQGGRERLKKESQQNTTPETPPHSHLLPPARCQLPVLTSKTRILISNSHNAFPLGSECLMQESSGDCRESQGAAGGSPVQRRALQTVKELTGFRSSSPLTVPSPRPHFRDTVQLQLLSSGIQLVLFRVCLLSSSTALFLFPKFLF